MWEVAPLPFGRPAPVQRIRVARTRCRAPAVDQSPRTRVRLLFQKLPMGIRASRECPVFALVQRHSARLVLVVFGPASGIE